MSEDFENVARMTRDLVKAGSLAGREEARFLVDAYYAMQENRIRASNQFKALEKSGEPHAVLQWLFTQNETLEKQIARVLDHYSNASPLGLWAREIYGIGPVLAAGLLAHIDIEKAITAGDIWRFAGLDPTVKWEAKTKRPWNASLKTLCWKIGESFVKVKGYPDDVYGKVYEKRKLYEEEKNERGDYAAQAELILKTKRIGKDTEAYAAYIQGRLPKGHIHARAKRVAVKLFLAHYQEQGWRLLFHKEPAKPYPIAILGHAHYIPPPNQAAV